MLRLKRYLRLYKVYCLQFIKSIVQSKLDFFMGLVGFFIVQFTGVMFLFLVFKEIPSIDGWYFNEILLMYGFAQLPRGIDHFFTDNLWAVAWNKVICGEFDRYMVRPINLLFQVISEKLQTDAIGEILVGSVLIIISIRNNVVSFSIEKWFAFIFSIVIGSILYTAIKLIFSSLAFWLQRSGTFLYTVYQTADFSKYPIQIYSKSIKFIISWIIPFAFVSYFPVSYFLGKNSFMATIGIEFIITIVFSIIAYIVFSRGTQVYESAGN